MEISLNNQCNNTKIATELLLSAKYLFSLALLVKESNSVIKFSQSANFV